LLVVRINKAFGACVGTATANRFGVSIAPDFIPHCGNMASIMFALGRPRDEHATSEKRLTFDPTGNVADTTR
jgi:hypothetical protein